MVKSNVALIGTRKKPKTKERLKRGVVKACGIVKKYAVYRFKDW